MFRLTLPLAVSSAILLSGVANAKNGAYVSALTGVTFKNISATKDTAGDSYIDGVYNDTLPSDKSKLKHAVPFGIAAGYNVQDFSFDLSYTYIQSKYSAEGAGKNISQFILANSYYNLNNLHDVIKPYAGFGVGVAMSKNSADGVTAKNKNAFAYQLAIGSKFNVYENIQLFADLRYTTSLKAGVKAFNIDGFNISSPNVKSNISIYSVNIGASYLF
jgi:opacity protein-like surface antigen